MPLNSTTQKYLLEIPKSLSVYDFPQSRAFMNSSSLNDSSLAASKCICRHNNKNNKQTC